MLPTKMAGCAAAVDAECLCELHAHALEVAPAERLSLQRKQMASTLACCMSEDDWVRDFGSRDLYREGRQWCDAGHGACGHPGDLEEESDDSRARVCARSDYRRFDC